MVKQSTTWLPGRRSTGNVSVVEPEALVDELGQALVDAAGAILYSSDVSVTPEVSTDWDPATKLKSRWIHRDGLTGSRALTETARVTEADVARTTQAGVARTLEGTEEIARPNSAWSEA